MDDAIDPRKLVAEALGAFTLVFAGAGAIILASGNANIGLLEIAFAHGLAIALMISALGVVSGGHFNPAVTLGFWVTRRISTPLAVGYVLAQLAGGIAASLVHVAVFPEGLRDAANLGAPALGPSVDFVNAVAIEAILTFFLVIVIFGTAVDPRGPKLGGLAIGLTITMDILVAGPLTGAVMNPARALGPALLAGDFTDQAVWWIGPALGGALGAFLYHTVFLSGPPIEEDTSRL